MLRLDCSATRTSLLLIVYRHFVVLCSLIGPGYARLWHGKGVYITRPFLPVCSRNMVPLNGCTVTEPVTVQILYCVFSHFQPHAEMALSLVRGGCRLVRGLPHHYSSRPSVVVHGIWSDKWGSIHIGRYRICQFWNWAGIEAWVLNRNWGSG